MLLFGLSEAEEQEDLDFIAKFMQVDMVFSTQLAVGAHKRKCCRTKDGRVGWVPQRAQVADLICLLYGGTVLHVLRHATVARYRLIGEAYVKVSCTAKRWRWRISNRKTSILNEKAQCFEENHPRPAWIPSFAHVLLLTKFCLSLSPGLSSCQGSSRHPRNTARLLIRVRE